MSQSKLVGEADERVKHLESKLERAQLKHKLDLDAEIRKILSLKEEAEDLQERLKEETER